MAKKTEPLVPDVHVRKDMVGMTALEAQQRYDRFLSTYATTGILSDAASGSGLSIAQILERRRLDQGFARQFVEAEECAQFVIESEAVRRATKGWEEPVYNKEGVLVGSITKYDGALLQFILKGNIRKYRGEDVSAVRGLSDEARRQLAGLRELAQP